jgi:hypothetical protein
LLGLFFDPEDGGDMFLRNVGWLLSECTELYPRRKNSSLFGIISLAAVTFFRYFLY